MSDHEWRFLTKSSMALGGFEFTPELGLAGGEGSGTLRGSPSVNWKLSALIEN
jgi:hypothetical protein